MNASSPLDDLRFKQLNEAADWIIRLGAGTPAEADIAEWLRWCDRDPGNLRAFEQLQADWRDLGTVKLAPEQRALEHRTTEAQAPAKESPRRRITAPVWGAMAAAVIGLALALVLLLPHPKPDPEVLETATAARTTTLPDGSSLILSARSALDIAFSSNERRLTLSHGEAYFKVRHDTQRPFIVRAGTLTVTAVGTAFDVRRDRDAVLVTVAEGKVSVMNGNEAAGKNPDHWQVSAGYQLTYQAGSSAASLVQVDPDRALRWRDGELAYVSVPLGTVIEELNRYADHQILIKEPAIGRLRYSGTVFTASVRDWVNAVAAAYSLQIDETQNGDFVIELPQK